MKHSPVGLLANYIQEIWLSEVDVRLPQRSLILPDGSLEIVLSLDDVPLYICDLAGQSQSLGHAVLTGAHTDSFTIDLPQPTTILGIKFRPGGAYSFLDMPLSEVQNSHLPLQDFWKNPIQEMGGQLREASTPTHRFSIVERFLITKMKSFNMVHPAVRYFIDQFSQSTSPRSVAEVTDGIGISSRHFIHLFRSQVGLKPKAFAQMQRLKSVLKQIGECESVDWVSIALEAGYCDQAHFIHAFRQYAGMTPTTYLARRSIPFSRHVPL